MKRTPMGQEGSLEPLPAAGPAKMGWPEPPHAIASAALDNLAHSLFGAHLSRLPPFRAIPQRLAFWTCVAASNVPDLDFLLRFAGEDRYVFEHRGLTHSLLGLLVLAPLTAWVASRIASPRSERPPFLPLLWVALVGVAGHLLLDVLTNWGTMLLTPFSETRFAIPILFIVDPWVWGMLGLPLLITAIRKRRGIPDRIVRRSSATALLLFSLYTVLCGRAFLKARSTALEAAVGNPREVRVWAAPGGPLLWTTAVRTEDHVWERSFVSALTGGATPAGTFPTGLDDPRVQVALESPIGGAYRRFADALYLVEATPVGEDGSYEVVLGDLRFSGPFWESVPFQLQLVVGPDFSVVDAGFVTGRMPVEIQPPGAQAGT